VRLAIKEVLRSETCSPADKLQIYSTMGKVTRSQSNLAMYLKELRTISDEIVREGGHLHLAGASFTQVVLDLNLTGANCENTSFSNVELADCSMSGANLTGSRFQNCVLFRSSVCGATMTGMTIKNSHIRGLVVSEKDLSKNVQGILTSNGAAEITATDEGRYVLETTGVVDFHYHERGGLLPSVSTQSPVKEHKYTESSS